MVDDDVGTTRGNSSFGNERKSSSSWGDVLGGFCYWFYREELAGVYAGAKSILGMEGGDVSFLGRIIVREDLGSCFVDLLYAHERFFLLGSSVRE